MPEPQTITVAVSAPAPIRITASAPTIISITVVYTGEPALAPPGGFILLSDGDGSPLTVPVAAYLMEPI